MTDQERRHVVDLLAAHEALTLGRLPTTRRET